MWPYYDKAAAAMIKVETVPVYLYTAVVHSCALIGGIGLVQCSAPQAQHVWHVNEMVAVFALGKRSSRETGAQHACTL